MVIEHSKTVYSVHNVARSNKHVEKMAEINVIRLPFETKNTLQIRKWESRFYLDSS